MVTVEHLRTFRIIVITRNSDAVTLNIITVTPLKDQYNYVDFVYLGYGILVAGYDSKFYKVIPIVDLSSFDLLVALIRTRTAKMNFSLIFTDFCRV